MIDLSAILPAAHIGLIILVVFVIAQFHLCAYYFPSFSFLSLYLYVRNFDDIRMSIVYWVIFTGLNVKVNPQQEWLWKHKCIFFF